MTSFLHTLKRCSPSGTFSHFPLCSVCVWLQGFRFWCCTFHWLNLARNNLSSLASKNNQIQEENIEACKSSFKLTFNLHALLSRDMTAHGKNSRDLKETITKCCLGDCHHGNYGTDLSWMAFVVQRVVWGLGGVGFPCRDYSEFALLAAKVIRDLL